MMIKRRYQQRNGAYTCGRKINVKGIMLHSYGCPQPDPNVLAEKWDNPNASACVHVHIGMENAILTLPCDIEAGKAARAWHAGKGKKGSGNDTYLAAEMTEPATIKYIGGSNWIELGDGSNTKAHVLSTYKNAVELFAQWCRFHRLDPLADGVILSHREACSRGIASNHGDVEHIWNQFGLTMAQFRQDVKNTMNGICIDSGGSVMVTDTSNQEVKSLDGFVTVIYSGKDGLNIRSAPDYNAKIVAVADEGDEHTVIGISKDEKWYKLDANMYISAVPDYVRFRATSAQKASTTGTGYYRVRQTWDNPGSQIGAFKAKENAIELCKQNSGYKVYDQSGKEVYPCITKKTVPFTVQIKNGELRIRRGPGTSFDYHKKNGQPVYTGKGKFTIVKIAEGVGAKMWGLLKSYAGKEDGWIPLDDNFV